MKLFVVLLLVFITGPAPYSAIAQDNGSDLKAVVKQLNEVQRVAGGSSPGLVAILDQIVASLENADRHSMLIAGDDGKVYHGGLVGDLIGAVLSLAGVLLGGEDGMCGNSHGLVMQQHQGLVGNILDLLGKLGLGSLANGGGQ